MKHETVASPIKISIPRAMPEELQRGVAAAMKVFHDAGVHPHTAAEGRFRREAWDIGGFRKNDITDEQLAAAAVWDQADTAALEAACAGWDEDRKPQSAGLEIIVDPEAQLADRPTAVGALRKIAESDPREWSKDEDSSVGIYAGIIASQIENPFRARDLVDPVTIAFHSVTSAQHRRQSLEANCDAGGAVLRVQPRTACARLTTCSAPMRRPAWSRQSRALAARFDSRYSAVDRAPLSAPFKRQAGCDRAFNQRNKGNLVQRLK